MNDKLAFNTTFIARRAAFFYWPGEKWRLVGWVDCAYSDAFGAEYRLTRLFCSNKLVRIALGCGGDVQGVDRGEAIEFGLALGVRHEFAGRGHRLFRGFEERFVELGFVCVLVKSRFGKNL